jgi:hypothetical protein
MRTTYVLIVLTILSACGCSTGSGAATAGSLSTPSAFAATLCPLIEPCCAGAGLSTAGTSCPALVTVLAGEGTYSPSAAATCVNALEQSGATLCSSFASGDGPFGSSCSGVFGLGSTSTTTGTAQPGQTCSVNTDCAPATGMGGGAECFSWSADGGLTHTCVQTTTTGMAGATPCVGTITYSGSGSSELGFGTTETTAPFTQAYICDTNDGVFCNPSTHACTPLGTVGSACSQDSDCVSTAYCAFGTGAASQCTQRIADGSSCQPTSDDCLTTSTCSPTTMLCTPLSPNGAACTSGATCQSQTCSSGTCGAGSTGLTVYCGK